MILCMPGVLDRQLHLRDGQRARIRAQACLCHAVRLFLVVAATNITKLDRCMNPPDVDTRSFVDETSFWELNELEIRWPLQIRLVT